jgi:RHS repeat-associated protein
MMPATVEYTYLGVGTLVRADYEEPDVRWDLITGSGSNPYAGLDQFGRVADCLWEKHSGTPADLVRLQYGYNRASSRLWRKDAVAAADFDELYSYDSLQRLTSMQRGTLDDPPTSISNQSLEQSWGLDTTGNWQEFGEAVFGSPTIEQERTSNTNNQITLIDNSVGSGWQTPVYDAAGHMLGMPNGVAGGPIARAATYDAWGRMMSITGAGLVTAGTYRYDGLNRRTIKNTQSGSTILETRHYYYSNQWQVLEERVGTSTDAERQYVWGLRYVDDLALRDRDTNGDGTLDERLYAMQDANWNVVAVCDENAAVEERYTYTAYGLPTYLDASFGSRSSSSFAWNYLYTGRERDNESALQYNRNRYYHARLGCWISRDPIGYAGGNITLYIYADSKPTVSADPTGWWRFVSGMGTLSGSLGPGDQTAYGDASSTFQLQFDRDKAAFQSNAKGTCCARIKFVQIYYQDVDSFGPTLLPNREWTIDADTPPYYPTGHFYNPSLPDSLNSSMTDDPYWGQLWKFARPSTLSMKFEVCAVCAESSAANGKTGIGDVFACLRWGHSFQIAGTIFNAHVVSWKRYVESLIWDDSTVVVGGPPGANNPRKDFTGVAEAPTDTMKTFLTTYFP